MKEHFCPVEHSIIAYQGQCNWCGERETLAQTQEPVAWMYSDDHERMLKTEAFCTVYSVKVGSPDKGVTDVPLYTTPSQRTWVGLTNEEIDKTLRVYEQDYGWISFAKAIEAILKEKNT